jgi:flap endonuclease-1
VGTDFNPGIKGVGPKTALKLVNAHGQLENMPVEIAEKIPENFEKIRRLYLEPDVTDDYDLKYGSLREEELIAFLCDERSFSRKRVDIVINRIKRSQTQKSLTDWFRGGA